MMFRGREYTQRKHYCIPNKPICWFSYPKTPCHPPRLNSILGLSVPVVLSLRHTALRCSFNSIRSNHVSSSSAYLITWCLSTEDMRHCVTSDLSPHTLALYQTPATINIITVHPLNWTFEVWILIPPGTKLINILEKRQDLTKIRKSLTGIVQAQ